MYAGLLVCSCHFFIRPAYGLQEVYKRIAALCRIQSVSVKPAAEPGFPNLSSDRKKHRNGERFGMNFIRVRGLSPVIEREGKAPSLKAGDSLLVVIV